MARRVYVHIGTMKSGTTYIQEFCNLNRAKLADAGLLWTVAVQNFRAVDDLLGTWRKRPGLDGTWARLSRQIARFEGDALISNELLAPIIKPNIEKLVDALAPAEVHVIITARELGKVIPSHWQEGARNGQTVTWKDFLASVRGDPGADEEVTNAFWRKHGLVRIIDRWSSHVARERITVVTVPKAPSTPLELAERFLSAAHVAVADPEQPGYLHEKMGSASAELMRRVNERSGDFDWLHRQWGLKQSLARHVLPQRAAGEPAITLTKAELVWVQRRAAAMIDGLAESKVRVIGDLSDLVPTADAPRSVKDPSDSTDGELVDAAIDGIVGMARMLADIRIEYDEMLRDLGSRLPGVSAVERERFVKEIEGTADSEGYVPRKGRLLRWKLGQLDEELGDTHPVEPPTPTG